MPWKDWDGRCGGIAKIPLGKTYDQVIEQELNAAHCVLVLWSKDSVVSRWVKTEASAAADKERLVPVLLDDAPNSIGVQADPDGDASSVGRRHRGPGVSAAA